MGKEVRAKRVESEIPLDPFTAGVYIATMMATVQVRGCKHIRCTHKAVVWV